MVEEISWKDISIVKKFLEKDIARNYFILLGLLNFQSTYDRVFGQWDNGQLIAVLFRRKSGTLQLYGAEGFNVRAFSKLIPLLESKILIGPKSYGDKFLREGIFSSYIDGGYISKLNKNKTININEDYNIEALKSEDLDEVIEIYEEVFKSFSPKAIMKEKLKTGRGRGVCIRQTGRIISLAQSEFEMKDGALIVGVATRPEFQGMGYGTQCLVSLCRNLLKEGKDIYLQYDNIKAGSIYYRLGFQTIDQVRHYKIKE